MKLNSLIFDRADFDQHYSQLCHELAKSKPFDRGEVHAQKVTQPEMVTLELRHEQLAIEVSDSLAEWQDMVQPNLPWAEDHFQERVSGQPLNPPPSHEWWPFNRAGNEEHLIDGKFSHTYPERFWPFEAGDHELGNMGIRFAYGDLDNLIQVLTKNPRTRQAYLPIWFPEDIMAAELGQRVPCTLGYHFLLTPEDTFDVTYYMRSCDIVRFFRDDVYMAGRLLQWVARSINITPGYLRMYIGSLHAFVGDLGFLQMAADAARIQAEFDARSSYNFDAL